MSDVIHIVNAEKIVYKCPGCCNSHVINIAGSGPRWAWNGDKEMPTLQPSVLVKYMEPSDDDFSNPLADTAAVCHSFIRNGAAVFLDDCTHANAGKVMYMIPWEGSI